MYMDYMLRVHFPNIMYYFQTDLLNINQYRAKYILGESKDTFAFSIIHLI